ncbi:putative PhoH family protein [Erwinia phage vB_EamM_Phobos]|uniref:PhoH-like phosphate starvation-inducible n=1 Tax=Erwinia phage vB_EamM_Phobos TaxID=1883377 RepID=UPI00081D2BD1|nr:PhoH-like phosphate starvation-inducible [Erwinia phage vB_EamM_Phobos]ANZ50282.1 putative PhoH family protein [Erwinia phage vB_EamM_Phobos]
MGREKKAPRVSRKAKQSTNGQVIPFPDNGFDESLPQVKRDTRPIEARNENQQQYMNALETKQLIFATGEAGCGKTFLCAAYAAERLLAKDFDRIIVTRPVLSADEDLGFLPGDVSEKFAPYFRPVYDVLSKRLGGQFLRYCLKPGIDKVEIAPFAYMRGRSFENAVILLDEAQNTTAQQMKLFLTRIGENCLVIVNGDITQCDLPKGVRSGLADALTRFDTDDLVSVIHFVKDDCVRSELCQRALYAYGDE